MYFLQDDKVFESRPRPTVKWGVDGNWVGATQRDTYFYLSVDPGEHHLCAEWESAVLINVGRPSAAGHFTRGSREVKLLLGPCYGLAGTLTARANSSRVRSGDARAVRRFSLILMFCPNCRAEYRPGFARCSDCDVPLVEHLDETDVHSNNPELSDTARTAVDRH